MIIMNTNTKKLAVVSGCPRSGTSLMMLLMRVTFGEERLLGKKWHREPDAFEQKEEETDAAWDLRQYWEQEKGSHAKAVELSEKVKDMNPNGFWEMEWTVAGIPARINKRAEVQEAMDKRGIVKVVAQGLASSYPEPVGKVIYMLRHPRAVAKSQERLIGQFGGTGNPERNKEEVRKHSPSMYARVTKMAAEYLELSGVDCLIVDFDDLIENPAHVLFTVQEFLGEGDFTEAISLVNPKLRRSYPKDIENPLWECVEEMHELMTKRDFAAVAKVEIPKGGDSDRHYYCHRMGRRVAENECNLCRTEPNTRANFKLTGSRALWYKHPCTWEVSNEEITVEESVALVATELSADLDNLDLLTETKKLEAMFEADTQQCDIESQQWLVAELLGHVKDLEIVY
jgi:hypothetical protein